MHKFYLSVIFILLAVIGFGTYKFILQGAVGNSPDNRISIKLSSSERNLLLKEMRSFLSSIQQITQSLVKDDFIKAAKAARASGRAAQKDVPGSLMSKLPLGFKKLGFDTHSRFDQLALDTADMVDKQLVLTQLSTLMQNCVSCHAAYRLDLEKQQ
ncbi:MAG TPA: hypothetical protein ENJ60_12425 [Aeromonadales bacterium]|nr:hypothetical protein [Aeromonadales bacterium]